MSNRITAFSFGDSIRILDNPLIKDSKYDGIILEASENVDMRLNVAVRNDSAGIRIHGPDCKNITVFGNYLGTDKDDTRNVGNTYGLVLSDGGPELRVSDRI